MKARRTVAAVCGLVAALAAAVSPVAADTPVTMVMEGAASANGGAPPNAVDWPFPECDPTVNTWTWFGSGEGNVEVDTPGSAYVGELGLSGSMASNTPCAVIDSGTVSLSAFTPLCRTTVCYQSAGYVSCSFTGSFLRVGTEMNMSLSGSCSVNYRPSVSVQLEGQWHLFVGPSQQIPYCGCGYYSPSGGPIDFTSTNVSG